MTTDCPAAEGYQIQTRSSRFVPGTGASVSNTTESVQSWIARPTAKEAVGVGSVTSDRFSSQRNPNNATIPRTPSTANTAKLLSTRRSDRAIVIRSSEAQAGEDPAVGCNEVAASLGPLYRRRRADTLKVLYVTKYFASRAEEIRLEAKLAAEWSAVAPSERAPVPVLS